MKAAWILIRKYSEISRDVFDDLSSGIQQTFETFKNLGTSQDIINEITQSLVNVAQLRKDFNKGLEKEVLGFYKGNMTPIQATSLLSTLNDLENGSKNISADLYERLKFVTVDEASGGAVDVMVELLTHQVGIFDDPLSSPFMEPIRKAYRQNDRTDQLSKSYRECLIGG